jgi:hypothetical protein
MLGVASAGAVVLMGCGSSSHPATSTATRPPSTTPPSTTTSLTTPTTGSLSQATAELNALLASRAAGEATAARAAGQTWNGYLHTPPVADGGALVAVVAFSYDPNTKPLRVLVYTGAQWTEVAELPPAPGPGFGTPPAAGMNSFWLANFDGAAISIADVTKDGRPDFLIPINAADNVPGAVVSQDGTPGGTGWRYIPYLQGSSTTQRYVFARDARLQGTTLLTTYDNCNPDCAGGTTFTITWTYQSKNGVFWAPNPP